MNKTALFVSTIFGITLIVPQQSGAEEFIDTAIVLDTSPVVERLYAPSKNCRHPAYSKRPQDDQTMTLLGALVGGVAGAQIGDGTEQDAAAALGAFFGAKIASGGGQITGEELLGAVAGGVIGNQVGGGSGKTASTAIGAVLGSALATGKLSHDRNVIARDCGDEVVSRRVITKYDVDYQYNGIRFSGTLPYKPSDRIDVIVDVEILEDRTI